MGQSDADRESLTKMATVERQCWNGADVPGLPLQMSGTVEHSFN